MFGKNKNLYIYIYIYALSVKSFELLRTSWILQMFKNVNLDKQFYSIVTQTNTSILRKRQQIEFN